MPSDKKLIKCIVNAIKENRKHKRRHRRRNCESTSRSCSRSRSPRRQTKSHSPEPIPRTSSPEQIIEVDPELPTIDNTDINETEPLNPYKEALGMDYEEPQKYMGKIHKDLRYNHILTKGLTKEEIEIITKKHTIPDNCTMLDAPILNPEVKAVLTESSRIRDYGIEMSQKQCGLATSIIAKAMTDLITSSDTDKHKLLTDLADATKLLSNIHYHQTQTRIKLISPLLDKKLNQVLYKSTRDAFLYGENLPELLRNVKQMQQTSAQIKRPNSIAPPNLKPRNSNNQQRNQGNGNRPSLKTKRNARGGPPKTNQSSGPRRPRWNHHSERVANQQARSRNAPPKR